MTRKCCEITDEAFTEDEVEAELKHYRRHGPANQTKLILESVRALGLTDAELLDIGGGIGAIYHELLGDFARGAVHVDASSAYLAAARQETARRGNSERVQFIHADFTDVANELKEADIVTLDRVVCCYPDFRALLIAAAGRCRRGLAMTYPREIWYMRLGLTVMNFFQRVRRDPFRSFLHSVGDMNALLEAQGLRRSSLRRLLVWEMAFYSRG